MKRLYFVFLAAIVGCSLSAQSLPEGFNCSSIIVGRDASHTGNILIGHNEDDGGRQVVNFYKFYNNQNPGKKVVFKNGAVLDQAESIFGHIWLEMPGQDFADTFLNSKGVLISSNSCPSKERYGEIVDGGVGYNLRKIVAERAETARHGVEIAGEIISALGYNASGRTYTIADTREAWMLSVVRGKHWVAMRIPDNHVVYLPNYYIIAGVDFEDKSNYLASPGLVEYAITRKWYDPAGGEFNFREAYGNPGSAESMSNTGRMWMGVNGLSADQYAINDKFPVSFVPARPLKIEDIIHLLANHYEGTHLDDSENYAEHNPHENKIMNICAGHQQLSFVAELRHDMPVETGCRLWMAHRRGCVHAYMPVYYGIRDFPEEFKYLNDYDDVYQMHIDPPEEVYDRENGKAWWSFLKVTEYVDENYKDRIGERKDLKNTLQQEYFDLATEFDESLDERWKENKTRAIDDITEFNNMIFQKALESNERYLRGR